MPINLLLAITKPNMNSYKDKNHNNNINNINYYKKTPSVKFFCYLVVISLVSHSNYYQICPPLFTANNFNARLRVHEFIQFRLSKRTRLGLQRQTPVKVKSLPLPVQKAKCLEALFSPSKDRFHSSSFWIRNFFLSNFS